MLCLLIDIWVSLCDKVHPDLLFCIFIMLFWYKCIAFISGKQYVYVYYINVSLFLRIFNLSSAWCMSFFVKLLFLFPLSPCTAKWKNFENRWAFMKLETKYNTSFFNQIHMVAKKMKVLCLTPYIFKRCVQNCHRTLLIIQEVNRMGWFTGKLWVKFT